MAAGADLVLCVMVFTQQMAWMHEKYLRSGHLRDRALIPHSLKVFDENIAAAIRLVKAGGVDDTEKAYSLWRSRVKGWQRNPRLWRTEFVGACLQRQVAECPNRCFPSCLVAPVEPSKFISHRQHPSGG